MVIVEIPADPDPALKVNHGWSDVMLQFVPDETVRDAVTVFAAILMVFAETKRPGISMMFIKSFH
jgi:hypothetical protein